MTTKIETVKNRNSKFNKLSSAEKRVAIAKDVIESVKNNKLFAESGIYCELREQVDYFIDYTSKMDFHYSRCVELQDLFENNLIKSCVVCGMGALFISKVKLFNKCNVEIHRSFVFTNFNSSSYIIDNLKGIFTIKQLNN